MLDPSNFILTPNGTGGNKSPSPVHSGGGSARYIVQDPRWKFVGEETFPKPREFIGGPRKYRAGRGSSVPLDLSAL